MLEALNEIGEEGQGEAPHEDCQRAAAMLELTMSPEFAGWRRVELMFEAATEAGQLPRFDVALRELLRDDFGGISWGYELLPKPGDRRFFIRGYGYDEPVRLALERLRGHDGYTQGLERLAELLNLPQLS